MTTSVTLAHLQLEWDQEYLEYPHTNQWAHHDVASAADGRIVTGHPDGRSLLMFGPDGRHLDTVETQTIELHGIANDAAREDSFWIADPGEKCTPGEPEYDEFVRPGRVLNVSLTAREVVGEIHQPALEIYEDNAWHPTAVAHVRSGHDEDATESVWVADGYGESLLHQFSADGNYLSTLDGTSSGLAFNTPHTLIANSRGDATELLVADRTNRRIVVLSSVGEFLRTFGSDDLTSPSGLAVMNDGTILVTELFGAVTAFSAEEVLIGCMGLATAEDELRAGWPNDINAEGNASKPALHPGQFNSPHGICITAGAVLVTEWVIGGRVIRLVPV